MTSDSPLTIDWDPQPLRSATAFSEFARAAAPAIEAALEALLPPADARPAELHAAMRHSMFPGGKRLRPVLALIGCRVTGGDLRRALLPAVSTECLHTYSLIHDDLPCMDDDALRRGRPTCHVVYGEAIAVLAGDALHSLAFEAAAAGGADTVRELARAAGAAGMVGGQVGDMLAEGRADRRGTDVAEVEWIHDRKTGALITASLVLGAVAGRDDPLDRERVAAVRAYGDRIGRAFQIADDCLDCTGSSADLGKAPGQDEAAGKLTYPAAVGLEQSRALARRLVDEAIELAPRIARGCQPADEPERPLDWDCALLQDVANFVVARRS